MRRITKSALIMVGAAAATFAVFSQLASPASPIQPAAKTNNITFCDSEPEARTIPTVILDPVFVPLPTLPEVTIPSVELPCIPVPENPTVTLPNVTLPTLPNITLPTVTLPTIPDIVIPIPVFNTTTTQDPCTVNEAAVRAGVVSAAC